MSQKDTVTSYKFVCFGCGAEATVTVRGLWRSHEAVKPEGWTQKVVGGMFWKSYCPQCSKGGAK
jgi:thymidine kinase